VLRSQGGRGDVSLFTTTIHTLVSAVLKLSTQTQVRMAFAHEHFAQ
jgi:hypothetical protein